MSEQAEIYQPKNKNMPSVNWCVFNCTKLDKALAKRAFSKKFGAEKWPEVFDKMKTGIMELFHYAPNEYTIFYVNHIAKRVDCRQMDALRRKK